MVAGIAVKQLAGERPLTRLRPAERRPLPLGVHQLINLSSSVGICSRAAARCKSAAGVSPRRTATHMAASRTRAEPWKTPVMPKPVRITSALSCNAPWFARSKARVPLVPQQPGIPTAHGSTLPRLAASALLAQAMKPPDRADPVRRGGTLDAAQRADPELGVGHHQCHRGAVRGADRAGDARSSGRRVEPGTAAICHQAAAHSHDRDASATAAESEAQDRPGPWSANLSSLRMRSDDGGARRRGLGTANLDLSSRSPQTRQSQGGTS